MENILCVCGKTVIKHKGSDAITDVIKDSNTVLMVILVQKEKCAWRDISLGLCSIHVAFIFNVGHLRVNADRHGCG